MISRYLTAVIQFSRKADQPQYRSRLSNDQGDADSSTSTTVRTTSTHSGTIRYILSLVLMLIHIPRQAIYQTQARALLLIRFLAASDLACKLTGR